MYYITRSGLVVEVAKRENDLYQATAITQVEQFCQSEGRSSDWQALISLGEELRHMVRSVEELATDLFNREGKEP